MSLARRNLRTLLLLMSCSVWLLWLWLTGETARYLGPRTSWLVSFGGIALGVATLAYSRAPASFERERLTAADVPGFSALALPMIAGLLLAHTQLGALAASKKLTARGIDPSALDGARFAQLLEWGFRPSAGRRAQPGGSPPRAGSDPGATCASRASS